MLPTKTTIASLMFAVAILVNGCATTRELSGNPSPLKEWRVSLNKHYGGDWDRFILDYQIEIDAIRNSSPNKEGIENAQAAINSANDRLLPASRALADAQARVADADSAMTAAKAEYAARVVDVGAKNLPAKHEEKLIKKQAELALAIEMRESRQRDFDLASQNLDSALALMLPYDTMLRNKRNEIIGELILLAKAYHDTVDETLHFGRAAFNSGADTAQIVATGVASVSGSESTARALAALATGLQGVQESIDKRVFYEHASAALLSTMHAQRLKAEQVLVEKMFMSIDEYPLQLAIDDWATFLLTGELTDALREMSGTAGAKELSEIQALKELQLRSAENIAHLKKAREAKDAAKQELETVEQKIQLQVRKLLLEQLTPASPID